MAPTKDKAAVEQRFPEILSRSSSPGRTAGAWTSRGDRPGIPVQAPEAETGFPGAGSHTCGDKHTGRAGSSPGGEDYCPLASPLLSPPEVISLAKALRKLPV